MNSEEILAAVGEISDGLIAAAEPGRQERAQARNTNGKKKKKKIIAWSLSAAALALIVAGAILISVLGTGKLDPLTAYDYGYAFSADMMDGGTNAYKRVYRFSDELKAVDAIPDTETVSVCRVMRNDDQKKHAASMAESIASVWELLYGTRPEVNTTVQTASRKNFLKDEVTFEVDPGEGYQSVSSFASYSPSCELDFRLKSETDGKTVRDALAQLVPDAAARFAAVQTEDDARAQFADLIAALQTAAGERFSAVSVRLARMTTSTPTSRVTEITGVTISLSDPAMNAEADPKGSSPTFGSDCFRVLLQLKSNGEVNSTVSASYVTVKYVKTEEKRMSLGRAEELLAKNYVFSGYGGCPVCQSLQSKISFDDYDAVRLEYQAEEGRTTLPVYAFYKLLEKLEPSESQSPSVYGKDLYAVTFVPAVDMEGIEEYFEELHLYGSVNAMKFAHENACLEIDYFDPLSAFGVDLNLPSTEDYSRECWAWYDEIYSNVLDTDEEIPVYFCELTRKAGGVPAAEDDEIVRLKEDFFAALKKGGCSVREIRGSEYCLVRKGTRLFLVSTAINWVKNETRDLYHVGLTISFTRLDKTPGLSAKAIAAYYYNKLFE